MALGASLSLFNQASIEKFSMNAQFKNSEMRGWRHLSTVPTSSFPLRQQVRRMYIADKGTRPVYKFNPLMIRASALPPLQSIPLVKSTSIALTKSYNVIATNPVTSNVIPALGLVAFAAWGLLPLLGTIRSFFHSESGWKKSRTYHFSISYLQPLLLWTGATLVCRALDPIVLPTASSQAVKLRVLNFVRSLSTVLAFAYCLSSLIQQMQNLLMESTHLEPRTMGLDFAGKAVYWSVWIAAFALFMELLGFSTQRWVTAGGLGTVLLTLAGREIFTNFLSGVMIHATRPFIRNEWIQTKIEGYEVSGTVEHVGLWSPTIIRGDDREAVHIPNHKFTVSVVRNLTQKSHWRIKTHIAISHLDVSKINNIVADMRKVLAKHPQIEQQRLHRRVFLENINPDNQALLILISCFVKTSHFEEYLCVKEAILLDLLRVVSHHRARLATPIRTVQKIYGDPDIENIPYGETIYNRAGNPSSRPFLLIEPQTRVHSEEKHKAQTHQASDQKPTTQSDVSTANNSDNNKQQKVAATSGPTVNASENSQVEGNKGEAEKVQINHTEQVKRPSFEDNIVLGVALEGSKRTLPIEEGMSTGTHSSETNEMDKVGPASSVKDKKGQMPAGRGKVDSEGSR